MEFTSFSWSLLLSICIFAPGLILLSASLFVGFLMLLEKIGILDRMIRQESIIDK